MFGRDLFHTLLMGLIAVIITSQVAIAQHCAQFAGVWSVRYDVKDPTIGEVSVWPDGSTTEPFPSGMNCIGNRMTAVYDLPLLGIQTLDCWLKDKDLMWCRVI